MRVFFLEVLTPDVDGVIATYEAVDGLSFGPPQADLGGARTAPRPDGALLSIRASMHASEAPTVQPYRLVDDVQAAADTAEAAGATILHAPMAIPGGGPSPSMSKAACS